MTFTYQQLLARKQILEADTKQLEKLLQQQYTTTFERFKPWQRKLLAQEWRLWLVLILWLSFFGFFVWLVRLLLHQKFQLLWRDKIKIAPWHKALFATTGLQGDWNTKQADPLLDQAMQKRLHLFDVPKRAKKTNASLVMSQTNLLGTFCYQVMDYTWRVLSSSGSATWTKQQTRRVVAILFLPPKSTKSDLNSFLFRLNNDRNVLTQKTKPKTWSWFESDNASFRQKLSLSTNNLTLVEQMMTPHITDLYVRNNRWMTYSFALKWYLYRESNDYFLCYRPHRLANHLEPQVVKPRKTSAIRVDDFSWVAATALKLKKDFFSLYVACEMILLTNNYQF